MIDPITATVLGGSLGGVANGIGSFFGGTKSADVSAAAAARNTEKQIAWEHERALHAHQWEVEDLKKAGINPILSAGGSGAVTGGINPQLPDTSGINSAYQAMGNGIQNAIQTAFGNYITSKQTQHDYEKIISQINLNNELGMEAQAKTIEHLKNAHLADKNAITATEQALKTKAEKSLVEEQTTQIKMLRSEVEEKIKQARANTLLLYEDIKNAPTKSEKLKAETKFKKAQADLLKATKIAATIGTTVAGAGSLVLGVLKYKKVYELGKRAIKILNNVP